MEEGASFSRGRTAPAQTLRGAPGATPSRGSRAPGPAAQPGVGSRTIPCPRYGTDVGSTTVPCPRAQPDEGSITIPCPRYGTHPGVGWRPIPCPRYGRDVGLTEVPSHKAQPDVGSTAVPCPRQSEDEGSMVIPCPATRNSPPTISSPGTQVKEVGSTTVPSPQRIPQRGGIAGRLRSPLFQRATQAEGRRGRAPTPLPPPDIRDVTPPRGPQDANRDPREPVRWTRAKRARLEDKLFSFRDGRSLAGALRNATGWEDIPRLALAAHTAGEKDRLWASFEGFWGGLSAGTPSDEAVLRYVWTRLGSISCRTAKTYLERLAAIAIEQGERGTRTRRLQNAKKALRRLSTLIRPRQAPPVATAQVHEALGALQGRARVLLALCWVTRCRVPDLRFVTRADWREIDGAGGDSRATSAAVYAKEKQALEWRPEIFLPAGPITAIVVEYMRTVAPSSTELIFGGNSTKYAGLKKAILAALPEGSWLHSSRRGAIQEVQKGDGGPRPLLKRLLRHGKDAEDTTARYLTTTNDHQRKTEAELLRALQMSDAGEGPCWDFLMSGVGYADEPGVIGLEDPEYDLDEFEILGRRPPSRSSERLDDFQSGCLEYDKLRTYADELGVSPDFLDWCTEGGLIARHQTSAVPLPGPTSDLKPSFVAQCISARVLRLLGRGDPKRGVVRMFDIAKADPCVRRLILDGRPVNRRLPKPPKFRLPTVHEIARALRDTDACMAQVIDIRGFFHQFPLSEGVSSFFSVRVAQRWYAWTRLPMGYSYAPWIALPLRLSRALPMISGGYHSADALGKIFALLRP